MGPFNCNSGMRCAGSAKSHPWKVNGSAGLLYSARVASVRCNPVVKPFFISASLLPISRPRWSWSPRPTR
jgi:hypothetical protein